MRCWLPALALGLALAVPDPSAEEPAPRPRRHHVRVASAADLAMLSQLAHGEDPEAVAAVVWVVLNRGGCRLLPLRCERPIRSVVLAPRAFGTVRSGRWRASWRPEGPTSARTRSQVMAVLLGRVPDPTGGATHFHRVGTWTPPWAPAPAGWRVLGSHAFYKARRPVGTKKNLPAKAVGLVKPWTATTAGPELAPKLAAIAEALGAYPHAPLALPIRGLKGSRLRLFECGCPNPVKVRVARDEFNATCDDCGQPFARRDA